MQITSRFTIAVHMLLCMDVFQEEYKVTSEFMAFSIGVNPVIVRKLLSQLKDAGLAEVRRGPGGAAATRPGRICPRPRSRPRPSQDLPTPAARSFSDSCSGSPARRAVLCLACLSLPIVPSDDHPADCSPGPGSLGFPPRGRQGLRTTFRSLPEARLL